MNNLKNKFFGCFIGAIVGDALGMPYEFKNPKDVNYKPEMIAGGPFQLPKGCWTDDTSMMLCLADSLIQKKGFDVQDQLLKYLRWYQDGYNSAIGRCFDIGNQTRDALDRFDRDVKLIVAKPTTFKAGNGALMRIAPIPLIYVNLTDLFKYSKESTIATHNNETCITYSNLYCKAIHDQLLSDEKITINSADYGHCSGYVKDSYYLALDAFNNTNSFTECMEYVIKIGGDTDTNACIAGMLAGAYYGFKNIPKQWIDNLINVDDLILKCEQLYQLRLRLNN